MAAMRCPQCGSNRVQVDPDINLIDRFRTIFTYLLWIALRVINQEIRSRKEITHRYACENCGFQWRV